jgi:biuret amidohydrolase
MKDNDYLGALQHKATPPAQETALLLVDLQNATVSRDHGTGRYLREHGLKEERNARYARIEKVVLPNTGRLIRSFRSAGSRVLWITVGSTSGDYEDLCPPLKRVLRATNNRVGEPEHDIHLLVAPNPGETVLNKTTFGSFISTNLHEQLQAAGIKWLVISGVATSVCVETTVREAADRGYHCILVEDACADTNERFHREAIATLGRLFALIWTTDEITEWLSRVKPNTLKTSGVGGQRTT